MNESTADAFSAFVPMAVIAIVYGVVMIAAHRFAKRREREGLWNKDGPVDPSEPPAAFLRQSGYLPPRPTIESEPEDEPEEPHDHHRRT